MCVLKGISNNMQLHLVELEAGLNIAAEVLEKEYKHREGLEKE